MIARIFHWLWLPILSAIVAGTTALFFCRPIKIESSFYSLLPLSQNTAIKQEAIEKISKKSASLVHIIFVPTSDGDLTNAIEQQKKFVSAALDGNAFELDTLAAPPNEMLKTVASIFKPYRFQLLSEKHAQLLEQNNAEKLAENALAALHSPVSARILPVRDDPFGLLTDFFLENPLLRSPFHFIDGVPVAKLANEQFVAYLPLRARNHDSLKQLVADIEHLQTLQTQLSNSMVKIELAGVPVHTAISASQSLREINMLSLASIGFLFIIFFAVFRSLKTFFVGAGTLALAGTLAFVCTNAIFGNIHTLTLVFGCSLLGIAVDYILHLVIAGTLTRALARALILSAGTTCLAFAVFLFEKVELLQQIATFTIIGIAGTLLIALTILARFDWLKKSFPRERALNNANKLANFFNAAGTLKYSQICVFGTLLLAGTLAVIFGNYREDLKKLYEPSPALKQAEMHYAQMVGYQSMQTFLATAPDETTLLNKLNQFEKSVLEQNKNAQITSISQLVPAPEIQTRNFKLTQKLLKNPPENFPIHVKNLPPKMELFTPTKFFENRAFDDISMLFGKHGDEFYAVVLVKNTDKNSVEKIAGTQAFLNLDFISETNRFLENCRNQTAIYLALALAGTLILFTLSYGIQRGPRMILPTLGALAGTLAVMSACGIAISLFHLLALFLILGFGVDYIIHATENQARSRESSLSILLSCTTTFVAFGFLAFTAFPLTREIGILVAVGLMFSYTLSNFVAIKK